MFSPLSKECNSFTCGRKFQDAAKDKGKGNLKRLFHLYLSQYLIVLTNDKQLVELLTQANYSDQSCVILVGQGRGNEYQYQRSADWLPTVKCNV